MNCGKMEKYILGYVDGRLEARELRKAEAHLAGCAECGRRVTEFRAVSGLLEEMPKIMPTEGFDARLQARIAVEAARESWWAWLAPAPRVAFAAALLALLCVWVGSRPRDVDAYPHYAGAEMRAEDQMRMVKDLPVLEDFDVLENFEPLADLPPAVQAEGN
ncbi:MAG: zf-HC2 domain-containing protein [Acidobacteriia bacterium]|nr:zf-HC2 domain-containing protein [Terriglobia bacterium]